MKKTLLIISLFVSATAFAQDESNFLDKYILGKEKSEPLSLSLDTYPFLFLASGGGGSVSVELGNWQVGAIGFSTVPPDNIINTFFDNNQTVKVRRNNAVELFANYYLRKDRKGIYTGVLGGPEWFVMEDKLTGQKETIVKSYVVPRLGFRVFPFKRYFYADASFGWSFNVSGTEKKTIGLSTYNASGGGFIYFLQLGARFNLSKY